MNISEGPVYVDIDDTLIRTTGSKRIPILKTINYVKSLHKQNIDLYCWSSGGKNYCQEIAKELGIDHCFKAFLTKPKFMIDDQDPKYWRYLNVIHPNDINI